MGRPEKPIDDTGPLGDWATRFRDLRDSRGKPTYREMAKKCHFSHSTLAEATAGKIFPAWEVAEAFVTVLGAVDELPEWRQFWLETEQAIGNLRRKLGEAGLILPEDGETRGPRQGTRLRGVTADVLEPEQCRPQPQMVRTFDDLRMQLRQLKIMAGDPSFRDLHRLMDKRHSVSALNELFTGKRRPPNQEITIAVVKVLLQKAHDEEPPKALVDAWRAAWGYAQTNRLRIDLEPQYQRRTLFVQTDSQDVGPLAGVLAEMELGHAVAFLAQMDKAAAAKLIQQLPPDRAMAVIKAMAEMERPVKPQPPATKAAGDGQAGGRKRKTDGEEDPPTGPRLKPV